MAYQQKNSDKHTMFTGEGRKEENMEKIKTLLLFLLVEFKSGSEFFRFPEVGSVLLVVFLFLSKFYLFSFSFWLLPPLLLQTPSVRNRKVLPSCLTLRVLTSQCLQLPLKLTAPHPHWRVHTSSLLFC